MSLSGAVQVITLSGAIGLQANSACLLGHLYLAHMSNSYSHSSGEFGPSHWTMASLQSSQWPLWPLCRHSLSSSGLQLSAWKECHQISRDLPHRGREKRFWSERYSCLPPSHVTPSLPVNPLNAGPDFVHPVLVKTAVTSLASVGAGFQFPPVNWSVSLSPLMRLGFGEIDQLSSSFRALDPLRDAQNVVSAGRRRRSASVFGAGSISSSLFSECCSPSGLLGVTATCSQHKCEYLVQTMERNFFY